MNKKSKMVMVYRAAGEAQAYIIKGLLESHGIACMLQSNAAPSVHVFTIDGLGETRVLVHESDAAEAKEIIEGSGRAQVVGESD